MLGAELCFCNASFFGEAQSRHTALQYLQGQVTGANSNNVDDSKRGHEEWEPRPESGLSIEAEGRAIPWAGP